MGPAQPESERLAQWIPSIHAIARHPGVVMVIGASDRGKTTWIRFAAKALRKLGTAPIAVVDADLGQSTFGPPATVALYLVENDRDIDRDAERGAYHALAFVGSVTPLGHLLQTLTACHRLVRTARRWGAGTVLVDTSGLVTGSIGFQLKLRKTELLHPRHVIALQRDDELEPLLSILGGQPAIRIHRLSVPSVIRQRLPSERAAYRAHRFTTYFSHAKTRLLSMDSLFCLLPPLFPRRRSSVFLPPVFPGDTLPSFVADEFSGSLLGLQDAADETLGLGLLEGIHCDRRALAISSPLDDVSRVKMIQFSRLRPNLPDHSPGV